MKKIFNYVCTGLTVCMCACSGLLSPQAYEEEIKDAVKYHIAVADYMIELCKNPMFALGAALASEQLEAAIDQMETEFKKIYESEVEITYQQVLERVAKNSRSDFQEDAKGILKHYKKVNASLSDYVESSTRSDYKSWKFKEHHSDVEFLFEINGLDTENPIWVCAPIEKSYSKYIENGVK